MSRLHTEIERLEAGRFYTGAEAEAVMEELLSGRVETPEILRLLTVLNRRPVQVQELAGFARVMRRNATRVFADSEARPEPGRRAEHV
jgi:anthranilate phosphoribosyltransferase